MDSEIQYLDDLMLREITIIKEKYCILKKEVELKYKTKHSSSDYTRKSIPKSLKCLVWNKYIGKELGIGYCYVCKEEIDSKQFECGHIQSVKDGGINHIDNLLPICGSCNKSMGTQNLNAFKKLYFKKEKSGHWKLSDDDKYSHLEPIYNSHALMYVDDPVHILRYNGLIVWFGGNSGEVTKVNKKSAWVKWIDEDEVSFTKLSIKEINEKCVSYLIKPKIIEITDEEYNMVISRKTNKYDQKHLEKLIANYFNANILKEYTKDCIMEPLTDNQYHKIEHLNKCAIEGTNSLRSIRTPSNKLQGKDIYQIWLDYKNKHLILCLHHESMVNQTWNDIWLS